MQSYTYCISVRRASYCCDLADFDTGYCFMNNETKQQQNTVLIILLKLICSSALPSEYAWYIGNATLFVSVPSLAVLADLFVSVPSLAIPATATLCCKHFTSAVVSARKCCNTSSSRRTRRRSRCSHVLRTSSTALPHRRKKWAPLHQRNLSPDWERRMVSVYLCVTAFTWTGTHKIIFRWHSCAVMTYFQCG